MFPVYRNLVSLSAALCVCAFLAVACVFPKEAVARTNAQTNTQKTAQTQASSADPTDMPVLAPVVGVDWAAPTDFQEAGGDLFEIAEVGFSAVRTSPVYDQGFYTLADSLGLTIYTELPYVSLSGRQLVDSLAVADSLLDLILSVGVGHASAGPIGIARLSDTSSSRACEAISASTRKINAVGRQAYYTTRFSQDDQCLSSVDFVLLDVLGEHDPSEVVSFLMASKGPITGLSGVGYAVEPSTPPGWINQGSIDAQARFMETVLNEVDASSASHVFLHRWRDIEQEGGRAVDPWNRDFGLYTAESDPRPALQVIRGHLLGIQTTFAFDRGAPPSGAFPWYLLLGWVLLALTSIMYAGSPRFRSMIPRYFFAHGFFRNAVREAREVLPLTSTAILTVTGLSIGMIGSLVVVGIKDTEVVVHLIRQLSPANHRSLTSIVEAPFVLTVLLGSAALLSSSVWMACWMIVSGRRSPLLPSQALMLAAWPRWQVLFLLPVAMTLAATPDVPLWSILLLGLGWITTAYWATIRTAFDLFKISSISTPAAVLVWLLNPLSLGAIFVLGWTVLHFDRMVFIWHLMIRS